MKNTWVHSALIVLIGALALASIHVISVRAVSPELYAGPNRELFASLFGPPIQMLEKLVPGLVLGWFTRRHPLVVGSITGALASYATPLFLPYALDPISLAGLAIANALVVAVAFLAGRALNYRFRPQNQRLVSGPIERPTVKPTR